MISSALLTRVVLPISYYGAGAVRTWLLRRRRGAIGAAGPDSAGGPDVTGS